MNIQVWLVQGNEGFVLVDCGIPPMANGIIKCIQELGSLNKIVLTHGHPDHIGGLSKILRAFPVPVFVHRLELPYMEGKLPYPPFKKPRARVSASTVQPLPEHEFGGLMEVDGLIPYWAPGHSPGHTVFYHAQDQVLIAGDLFMTRRNRLRKPLSFATGDMAQAVESGALVMDLQPALMTVCHGKDIVQPHRQYPAYRRAWDRRMGGALS